MHSAKNYLIAFLALTTVGTSLLAWRQHRELISLRAAALDPKERADWQQRLWAAEKRHAELEQQLAAAAGARSPADAASDSAGTTATPELPAPESARGSSRGAGQNRFAALMDQPEMQRLMALQHKAALDGRYAGLFKQLSLSPEQLERFKNLLVEKTTAAMDVMAAAREQGVNPRRDRDTFRQLVSDAEADVDANIRALLGESGFAQYKDYERTQPQRSVVNQLEQRLSYSNTPLTPDQNAQLVRILANTASSSGANSGPAPFVAAAFGRTAGGPLGPQPNITDAAIDQSLGVLAAPQVEALRQLQQEQQAQVEIAAAFRNQAQRNRESPRASPPTGSSTVPGTSAKAGGE